nr:hypothetical protein [Chloroflexota bacterium]
MHNKVGAVVILIAIGLLSSCALTWPSRDVFWHGIIFTLSGRRLLGLVLLGLACAGTDFIVHEHPRVPSQQQNPTSCSTEAQYPFLHWILPAALTTAVWGLLARPGPLEAKAIGIAITSAALALLLYAEYYAVNSTRYWGALAQFALQLATYLLAALVYFTIHECISVARIAADTVAVASALLSLRLLGDEHLPSFSRVSLCTLGVGSLLGIISWWLLPRVASPLLYSFSLIIFLYGLTGIARQFLRGKFSREISLEYLLVSVLALLMLFLYSR